MEDGKPRPQTPDDAIERLSACIRSLPEVEVAVLVGSRVNGTHGPESDWDIALFMKRTKESPLAELQRVERVRCCLARELRVIPEKVDLIDLSMARLAMRALAAEDGLVLVGEDSPTWYRFLQRTWRELEEAEWEKTHAT